MHNEVTGSQYGNCNAILDNTPDIEPDCVIENEIEHDSDDTFLKDHNYYETFQSLTPYIEMSLHIPISGFVEQKLKTKINRKTCRTSFKHHY